MTGRTNARIAGFTFLFYIVIGITDMVLFGQATSGQGIAAKLANIADHATLTRDYDRDLALLEVISWGWFPWMPMLVFEVTLALWLLIKGVAPQPTRSPA